MTTILADTRLGIVVSDSAVNDGDRQWVGRKVWRHRGSLLAFSGDMDEAIQFLEWFKGGCASRGPRFNNSQALVMNAQGLHHYAHSLIPMNVPRGIEAIGTGAKAAICTYEALGWQDPIQAVKIVCRHDLNSRKPVRCYRLVQGKK